MSRSIALIRDVEVPGYKDTSVTTARLGRGRSAPLAGLALSAVLSGLPATATSLPPRIVHHAGSPSRGGLLEEINGMLLFGRSESAAAMSFGRLQAPHRQRHVFAARLSYIGPRMPSIILREEDVASGELDLHGDG